MLDPFILKQVSCRIGNDSDVELDNDCPVARLLLVAGIGRHVKVLQISTDCLHRSTGERDDRSFRQIREVLRQTSANLTDLTIARVADTESARYFYALEGVIAFPKLKRLSIEDEAFVTFVPPFLNNAPALQTITLIGSTLDSRAAEPTFQDMVQHLTYSDALARGANAPMRAIRHMKIHDFGSSWIQAFLAVFMPCAEEVLLYCKNTLWNGEEDEHVAALAHLATFDGFRKLTIQLDEAVDPYDYYVEGIQSREALLDSLAQRWKGKNVDMYIQRPRKTWEQPEDEDAWELEFKQLFRWQKACS